MADTKEATKASFFAMIRADPTNNDNRLIFADWCEEHGEAELAADLRGGSEKWLHEFIESFHSPDYELYCDYDRLIQEAQDPEGFFTASGYDLHGADELGKERENEFWHHIQVMTGTDYGPEHRASFGWSCSC